MATKQTTAVEWLADKMVEILGNKCNELSVDQTLRNHYAFKQALEMEQTQTVKAYEAGQEDEYQYHVNAVPRTDSEQYYTDTYGKERNHSEQAIEMQRPRWVQFSERKPTESKHYFVKGKGDYGGYLFYFDSLGEFELGNLPVNKFSDEYLQWFEE
jgi:hypothetical protein